jgi:RNA-binding protein YhbY
VCVEREDNAKVVLKKEGVKVDWIHLTQNRVQRQDLVKVKIYCTFFFTLK